MRFFSRSRQERTPPLIDDFLYICDGAYVKRELTRMEMNVFRTIGYDLGIPLSYRFLRRYARVSVVIKVLVDEMLWTILLYDFCFLFYFEVCQSCDARTHIGALHSGILTHELWGD